MRKADRKQLWATLVIGTVVATVLSIVVLALGDAKPARAAACPPDDLLVEVVPMSGPPPLSTSISMDGDVYITDAERDLNNGYGPGVNIHWGDGSATSHVLGDDAGHNNTCDQTFLMFFNEGNAVHVYQNPGTYQVSYTIDGRSGSHSVGTVQVGTQSNDPPAVNAGADLRAKGTDLGPLKVRMKGSVTDDGLPNPPAKWTAKWTQVLGPQKPDGTQAKSTFVSPSSPTSDVTIPPVAGDYVFKLAASDGAKTAEDTVKITRFDHYRVETMAWIPQKLVVDPLHPLKEILSPGQTVPFRDSCWYQKRIIAHKHSHISYFNGNNHRSYDGNPSDPYKGRVWVEFDWDGKSMTSKKVMPRNEPGSIGHTVRFFFLRDMVTGELRVCGKPGQEKKDLYSSFPTSNTARLYMRTQNPFFYLHEDFPVDYAPPIDEDIKVTFLDATTMKVAGYRDNFPSHGYRVFKNSKTMFTHRTFDAWCTPTLGWKGAWAVFNGLKSPEGPQKPTNVLRAVRTDSTVAQTVAPNCKP